MESYFDFSKTLHNETSPTGYLGRGTHYSIIRTVTWINSDLSLSNEPFIHDFGIIWDIDHDTRIIEIIKRLYFASLLSPVIFLGERKGTITLLIDDKFSTSFLKDYRKKIESIKLGNKIDFDEISKTSDEWVECVTRVKDEDNSIICDDKQKVDLYLNNLISLWNLGIKKAEKTAHNSQ
ncbi:MAG: hypothetical protein A2Y34_10405 [Spirochaetes bacterium GWC1_27_15]|nr:MAG: hypothetical protein A2Z98_09645 [Spirochaetes bacterium GWB1_27_13]OHD21330.1 MAG: hypothetical protein A2Y34_10405 [Spirochaetes bacterium GWC1_27_15]